MVGTRGIICEEIYIYIYIYIYMCVCVCVCVNAALLMLESGLCSNFKPRQTALKLPVCTVFWMNSVCICECECVWACYWCSPEIIQCCQLCSSKTSSGMSTQCQDESGSPSHGWCVSSLASIKVHFVWLPTLHRLPSCPSVLTAMC